MTDSHLLKKIQSIPGLFKLLVDRALNIAISDEFVLWAEMLLEQGRDSPGLRSLAGLSLPVQRAEVERYMGPLLSELGIEAEPSTQALVRARLFQIATDILAGQLSTQAGADAIWRISVGLRNPLWLMGWSKDDLEDNLELEDVAGRAAVDRTIRERAEDLLEKLEVQDALETGDEKRVRLFPASRITQYLYSLLLEENARSAKFNDLRRLGILLAKSGHERLDWDVADYAHVPESIRLSAASALLCGLWDAAVRSSPIDQQTLDKFLKAREKKYTTPDAEYASLQALCRALESKKLPKGSASKLAAILKDLTTLHRDPPWDTKAKELIRKALETHETV